MAQNKKDILQLYRDNCLDLDEINESLESSISNIQISETHLKKLQGLQGLQGLQKEIQELVILLKQYQNESRQATVRENIDDSKKLCKDIKRRHASIKNVKRKHVTKSDNDVKNIQAKKEVVNSFVVDLSDILDKINILHSKNVSRLVDADMVMDDWAVVPSSGAASSDAASSDVARPYTSGADSTDDEFDDDDFM